MKNYKELLVEKINSKLPKNLEILLKELRISLNKRNSVYLCGNGGSAANANHIANDFLYGLSSKLKKGLNVESLSSNVAVITCLANDIGYENIFSEQIKKLMCKDDLLIVLSGSGNSKNLINAVNLTNKMGISSFGILGFDGGNLKNICSDFIHIKSFDMQFCEDIQIQIGHYIMKKINI